MIDVERFLEVGPVRDDGIIEPVEAHLHRAGLDARAVEHVLEPNAGPERVAHGAVAPLRAWNAGLVEAARVAGALVDGGKLDLRQAHEIVE